MKTNNLYLNRLLRLATALETLETKNPGKKYKSSENYGTIEHFHWATEVVLDILKIDNTGGRKSELLYQVGLYYKLDFDSLLHLFAPYYQENYLGGIMLTSSSGPSEVAFNIREYVKIKEEESYIAVLDKKIHRIEKHFIVKRPLEFATINE